MPLWSSLIKSMKFTMCQNPPGDEIYIAYGEGKLHQIEMRPSYTIFFFPSALWGWKHWDLLGLLGLITTIL
jgi:hypothetical protein